MIDIFGIVFDLDGVIVDTAPLHYICWRETANRLGFDIDEEFNECLKGVSRIESLKKILDYGGIKRSDDEIAALAEEKNQRYVEKLKSLTKDDILPGIMDFLGEIKAKRIKTSIASASKNAPLILESLMLGGMFDAIANPARLRSKPCGDLFLKAAELISLPPERCVGIEDSEAGLQAIHSIGMKSVGVGSGKNIERLADIQVLDTSELSYSLVSGLMQATGRC